MRIRIFTILSLLWLSASTALADDTEIVLGEPEFHDGSVSVHCKIKIEGQEVAPSGAWQLVYYTRSTNTKTPPVYKYTYSSYGNYQNYSTYNWTSSTNEETLTFQMNNVSEGACIWVGLRGGVGSGYGLIGNAFPILLYNCYYVRDKENPNLMQIFIKGPDGNDLAPNEGTIYYERYNGTGTKEITTSSKSIQPGETINLEDIKEQVGSNSFYSQHFCYAAFVNGQQVSNKRAFPSRKTYSYQIQNTIMKKDLLTVSFFRDQAPFIPDNTNCTAYYFESNTNYSSPNASLFQSEGKQIEIHGANRSLISVSGENRYVYSALLSQDNTILAKMQTDMQQDVANGTLTTSWNYQNYRGIPTLGTASDGFTYDAYDYTGHLSATWSNATANLVTDEEDWTQTVRSFYHIPSSSETKPLSQSVSNLPAGNYTVQAIVRANAGTQIDLRLKSGSDEQQTNTTGVGADANARSAVNKYGRVDQIYLIGKELDKSGIEIPTGGWLKLETEASVEEDGTLDIALFANGRFDLSDVTLLKDANTTNGFQTTIGELAGDTNGGNYSSADRARIDLRSVTKFSFFDRGINPNRMVLLASNNIMSTGEYAHPFNCFAVSGNSGTAQFMYLCDDAETAPNSYYLPTSINYYYATRVSYDREFQAGIISTIALPFLLGDLLWDRLTAEGYKDYYRFTTKGYPWDYDFPEEVMNWGIIKSINDGHILMDFYGCFPGGSLGEWTDTSSGTLMWIRTLSTKRPFLNLLGRLSVMSSTGIGKQGGNIISNDSYQIYNWLNGNGQVHSHNTSTFNIGTYHPITINQTYAAPRIANRDIYYYSTKNPGVFTKADLQYNLKLKPFRAFIVAPKSETNGANTLPFVFDDITPVDLNETTGIKELPQIQSASNGRIYTLNGQLVRTDGNTEGLAKGIYILRGKKILIK